jgi:FdhE protein
MMRTGDLEELRGQHPEWLPWLTVVNEALKKLEDTSWEAAIADSELRPRGVAPLLAGATLRADRERIERLVADFDRCSLGGRALAASRMRAGEHSAIDVRAIFDAALNSDNCKLEQLAIDAGAEPGAFRAVASLLPLPLLHACRRRFADQLPTGWSQGYCPCCGNWATYAETRGIERSRHLRCARCGSAWPMPCLSCTYCGMTDHEMLGSLVVEGQESKAAIEVCKRCMGYLKSFRVLQADAPAQVMWRDIGSVESDLVAIDRGYGRPSEPGHALNVRLV